MVISVVVPTFNRRDTVRRTVELLFAQSFPHADYEVIVVVDGSSDGTTDALSPLKAPCRFQIVEQANKGLAGARNTGARAASGELLLFLDDDMLCVPELVAAHVTAHENSPRTVGFGCIFLSPDSPESLAAECFKREFGAFYLRQEDSPEAGDSELPHVFGNSSLPRALLNEAGGFDESLRMREDLDLWARLFALGALATYVPRAVAHQYYAKSAADLIRDAEAFAVADAAFARKHPAAWSRGEFGLATRPAGWKRGLRAMAAASPAVADLMLAPACGLGQMFFRVPGFRTMGVRALQMRRRIHWVHKIRALGVNLPGEPQMP